MTVDFTDSAIMGILKKTNEELSISLYTRDERKATFDHLKQASKTWKVNPDSSIEFNGADLQGEDKTVSLYMLAFLEMRQFLSASGKLDEREITWKPWNWCYSQSNRTGQRCEGNYCSRK